MIIHFGSSALVELPLIPLVDPRTDPKIYFFWPFNFYLSFLQELLPPNPNWKRKTLMYPLKQGT